MATVVFLLVYTLTMMTNEQIYYKALKSRDERFDGRFFTGVLTTGIFCRPVCPASTPKAENGRFYTSAAEALAEGFRPCLRCRPESAPGSPAWNGVATTVNRALNLINDGALNDASVLQLAERLGVSDRHLRRLFDQQLGVNPLAIAQSHRVLFARKLMNESALPLKDIALSAGFGSVRRFNDTMLKLYGVPPSEIRRKKRSNQPQSESVVALKLAFRPPFDWTAMMRFFQSRAIPGVEEGGDAFYRRSIRFANGWGLLDIRPDKLATHLNATFYGVPIEELRKSVRKSRQLFDLDVDQIEVNELLSTDPLLASMVQQRPGIRVPGAWDLFELSVRAILGQQISVQAARTLAGRLVTRFGEPISAREGWAVTALFPRPEVLAEADVAVIGLPQKRAESIRSLGRAFAENQVDIDATASLEDVEKCLVKLPGIGPWTAQYIAMRALSEPDAFPKGDLGLIRAIEAQGLTCDIPSLQKMAEQWRPFRAYATLHLWASLGAGTAKKDERK